MRKLHFSLLLGLSVFATACVDIYKGPESIYNQDLELVLKPSMSGWNKEETLTAGIEAGLFIDAPGGGLTAESVYPGSSNLPLKLCEDGLLSASPAVLYPKDGTKFDFILYSPRMELTGNSIALESPEAAADLLYSGNLRGKYKSLSPLKPVFRHVPVKLLLRLSTGFGITEEEISASTISLSQTPVSGSFLLADGSFIQSGEKGSRTFALEDLQAECLAFPTPADSKETSVLLFEVAGKEFVVRIPDVSVFEYGNCYEFDVKVSIPGIEISLVEIKDWIANEEDGTADLI